MIRRAPDRTVVKIAFRLALIAMTLSLFVCREVDSAAGLSDVRLGLPIPFVSLDARGRAPPAYPARVCLGDPRRAPTRLRPIAALADLLALMAIVIALARLGRRVRSSRDGDERR